MANTNLAFVSEVNFLHKHDSKSKKIIRLKFAISTQAQPKFANRDKLLVERGQVCELSNATFVLLD